MREEKKKVNSEPSWLNFLFCGVDSFKVTRESRKRGIFSEIII